MSVQDECYVLLYANSSWYLFLRLYHMLCQRLRDIRRIADARQRECATNFESSCEQLIVFGEFYVFLHSLVDGSRAVDWQGRRASPEFSFINALSPQFG